MTAKEEINKQSNIIIVVNKHFIHFKNQGKFGERKVK